MKPSANASSPIPGVVCEQRSRERLQPRDALFRTVVQSVAQRLRRRLRRATRRQHLGNERVVTLRISRDHQVPGHDAGSHQDTRHDEVRQEASDGSRKVDREKLHDGRQWGARPGVDRHVSATDEILEIGTQVLVETDRAGDRQGAGRRAVEQRETHQFIGVQRAHARAIDSFEECFEFDPCGLALPAELGRLERGIGGHVDLVRCARGA